MYTLIHWYVYIYTKTLFTIYIHTNGYIQNDYMCVYVFIYRAVVRKIGKYNPKCQTNKNKNGKSVTVNSKSVFVCVLFFLLLIRTTHSRRNRNNKNKKINPTENFTVRKTLICILLFSKIYSITHTHTNTHMYTATIGIIQKYNIYLP